MTKILTIENPFMPFLEKVNELIEQDLTRPQGYSVLKCLDTDNLIAEERIYFWYVMGKCLSRMSWKSSGGDDSRDLMWRSYDSYEEAFLVGKEFGFTKFSKKLHFGRIRSMIQLVQKLGFSDFRNRLRNKAAYLLEVSQKRFPNCERFKWLAEELPVE